MRTLRYLLEKEFKQIKRDRFLPRIIFLVPLMQLIILPLQRILKCAISTWV